MQQKIITLNSASTVTLGDVNGSSSVDALDASNILAAYARESIGGSIGFSREQEKAADVNGDNCINSYDASLVLAYYSHTSTGGKSTLENFIASK